MSCKRIDYRPGYSFRTFVRGRETVVTVITYHGLGTCDVQTADGRFVRISGLPLVQA